MIQTILSVPGHLEAMALKARQRGAGQVAWDLEDSVPVSLKEAARALVVRHARPGDAVRVNPVGSQWFLDDVEAVAVCGQINLPKVEGSPVIDIVRGMAPETAILAVIESPAGIRRADEICAAADAVAFGRADFCAAVGQADPGCRAVLHAMGEIAMAALAAGIPAYDSPCEAFDEAEVEQESLLALSFCFAGKICIHPGQLGIVQRVFSTSDRALAEAAELAVLRGSGAQRIEGRMVAEPHYRLAEKIGGTN